MTAFHELPERARIDLFKMAIDYVYVEPRAEPSRVYAWMAGYTNDFRFIRLRRKSLIAKRLTAGPRIFSDVPEPTRARGW